ncbi:MAG: carbon-nitrogen hydrolase family protein [Patescibacteria group bacterium]
MHPRIAVVQFRITHLDTEANFTRIEEFIQRAKSDLADVVVFPEDCITASIFGDLTKLDTDRTVRDRFRSLAKKYAIDIVTGSVMEKTEEGNFNTSYYIDFEGNVLGTYRKNHLYPAEYRFLNPGTDAPVFETRFGRAGIVICWDVLFPEIFERIRKQGVQIVYCPSYWYREIAESMAEYNPRSEEQLLDALCIARSVETNAALVYCNAAGVMTFPNGSTDTLIGHSQIVMPVLGAIERAEHNEESMITQSIDLTLLDGSARIYREK